jgi:hypothetical protein
MSQENVEVVRRGFAASPGRIAHRYRLPAVTIWRLRPGRGPAFVALLQGPIARQRVLSLGFAAEATTGRARTKTRSGGLQGDTGLSPRIRVLCGEIMGKWFPLESGSGRVVAVTASLAA